MTANSTEHVAYHVLLIGIDAYERQPLKGCVNDIDSIQRVLVERANVPISQITRLVSPHESYVPDSAIHAEAATLENIVAALVRLGSEDVGPTDRVFIYYAGHGTRIEVGNDGGSSDFRGETKRYREALVPVDGSLQGPTLLLDFELNALLANIASRTSAVTVILDCCHSSGATRSLEPPSDNTRFVNLSDESDHSGPVTMTAERAQLVPSSILGPGSDSSSGSGSVDDCQIVAACLNHELAKETPRVVAEGEMRGGLLTRSLVDALAEIPDDELTTATWSRFWHQVRANIESHADTPAQHSWMSGGLARQWLAGPPNNGDVGLGITRTAGANEYVINAGTVAGITKGAKIAVYGHEPHSFPPLGTPEDETARIGPLLEVTDASASTAKATSTSDPFDLPAGARGRLAQAGESERLRVAVVPDDPTVVAAIGESDLVEVTDTNRALARLEQGPDGTWTLTDDVHGARTGDPVLARLRPDEVAQEARQVVEQYVRYAGPIRMAERCGDLPNALEIDLLDCPKDKQQDHKIPDSEIANLRELARDTDGSYLLQQEADYCVRIRNSSRQKLLVHLFTSDASGMVVSLGHQEIDGQTADHLWADGETGRPFWANCPDGQALCIDRFTAIGTTDMGVDLKHLEDGGTFRGGTRAVGTKRPTAPPAVEWTATGLIVRTAAATS